MQIAYRRIATRGFEGLRVRDVAREAGINHATLLYYFPTKEALIQEMVGYLAHEFSINRAPRPARASAASEAANVRPPAGLRPAVGCAPAAETPGRTPGRPVGAAHAGPQGPERGGPRPQGGDAALSPLEELRREFADVRYRVRAMPEMFVVLAELTIRSRRDPAITRILHTLFDGWREHLVSLLTRGVAEGAFRPDLDVEATARTIMAQLTAIG